MACVQSNMWQALFLYNFILFMVLFITEAASFGKKNNLLMLESISNTVQIMFFSLLAKSPGRTSQMDSKKLAWLLISLTGWMVYSLYKAMLGASLAITIQTKPFDTLEDIADSSFTVAVLANSHEEHIFSIAKEGSTLRQALFCTHF